MESKHITDEYEEDDFQDDIPIDDDEDEDEGIISDNYENFTDMRKNPTNYDDEDDDEDGIEEDSI